MAQVFQAQLSFSLLLRGVLLGFSIAAPVGPIGVLCIRRTLAQGRIYGLVSGLGAASADALYGAIAAFGLTLVSGLMIGGQFWLRLVGGLFLCYLGVRTALSQPAQEVGLDDRGSLLGAYASTFFLTLTNPLTILSFAAIMAGLGIGSATRDYPSAIVFVLGVFCGSALWWLALSSLVGLFRSRMHASHMVWLNRISGAIILAFGVVALFSLIQS